MWSGKSSATLTVLVPMEPVLPRRTTFFMGCVKMWRRYRYMMGALNKRLSSKSRMPPMPGNEDQGRTVVVAVPRHDAAGLDRQLAEPQFAILQMRRLLFEIDRTQRDVGDADRFEVDHLAGVGLHLVGGAFAGEGGRRRGDRSGDDAGQVRGPARACVNLRCA